MFRTTKKRSKPASSRVRLLDQEDGEDREVNLLERTKAKRSSQHKANHTRVRPFEEPEEALVVETTTSKRRKTTKTAGGLGFGGLAATEPNDSVDDDVGATTYDRDALSKLLAEQKYYVKSPEKDKPLTSNLAPQTSLPSRKVGGFMDTSGLPDDRPLNSKDRSRPIDASATILTGDEAMSYVEQQQQGNLDFIFQDNGNLERNGYEMASVLGSRVQHHHPQEETTDAWEAQVTRRAGLLPSSKAKAMPVTGWMPSPEGKGETATSSNGNPLATIGQLRTQISEVVQQLNDQQGDVKRRIERRKGELVNSETTVQRHETELKESGSALEFYQKWRNKLCLWVGAIRDLRLKVEPILVALHELEGEKSAVLRWQEWENDTIAVLQENGMLEQVIGRQPPPAIAPAVEAAVDEFGRDVKSQHVMQREKRRNHRRRIHQQRLSRLAAAQTVDISNSDFVRGDESDAFVSDGEEEAFRERHKALQKALSVAIHDLQEEFTMLQNLVDLFDEWHSAYPEEYKQCYASLSLADLAGILIQSELCAMSDPWNESGGYNEAKWTAVVHSAMDKGTIDQAALERLLQNWVFPAISDLLGKSGINLTSSRQTRSLSKFISHVQKVVPAGDPVWTKLHELLFSFAEQSLADIAIPIVIKPAHSTSFPSGQEELYRIKKILKNLLLYWAPIMQNEPGFCDLVLHFISSKLLFVLSSLHGTVQEGLAESPADVFQEVFQNLSSTGWLDYPEYMVEATMIQAAAAVYSPN
jgi:hypothetical protein